MSVSRRCFVGKAVNGKWYLQLGNFEYAYDAEDCTFYGPFNTQQQAEDELQNHANPGSVYLDSSGTLCVPAHPVMTKDIKRKWL